MSWEPELEPEVSRQVFRGRRSRVARAQTIRWKFEGQTFRALSTRLRCEPKKAGEFLNRGTRWSHQPFGVIAPLTGLRPEWRQGFTHGSDSP